MIARFSVFPFLGRSDAILLSSMIVGLGGTTISVLVMARCGFKRIVVANRALKPFALIVLVVCFALLLEVARLSVALLCSEDFKVVASIPYFVIALKNIASQAFGVVLLEEYIFRGVVLTSLASWQWTRFRTLRVVAASVLSSAGFVCAHLHLDGYANWIFCLQLFAIAALLATIYFHTQSLALCVAMHALWNVDYLVVYAPPPMARLAWFCTAACFVCVLSGCRLRAGDLGVVYRA